MNESLTEKVCRKATTLETILASTNVNSSEISTELLSLKNSLKRFDSVAERLEPISYFKNKDDKNDDKKANKPEKIPPVGFIVGFDFHLEQQREIIMLIKEIRSELNQIVEYFNDHI